MKKLIQLSISIALLGILNNSCSSYRILETSSVSKPVWMYANNRDLVLGFGTGQSLGEAKKTAFDNVKKNIAESIVQSIYLNQKIQRSEILNNNQYSFNSRYESNITTNTENIPEINGLSINNASKVYWEKIKNNGIITYHLYILYPFSRDKIHQLILTYNNRENLINDQLLSIIEKDIISYNSIDELVSDKKKLNYFYKHFKDQRKNLADVRIDEIDHLLNNLRISILQHDISTYSFCLKSNGKILDYSGTPKINTNCALVEYLAKSDKVWKLTLSFDDCNPRLDNFIEIDIHDTNFTLLKKIKIDLSEKYVLLSVQGPIRLKTTDWSFWENERNIKCYITVDNQSPISYKIKQVDLNFYKCVDLFLMDKRHIEMPIVVIDNISKVYHGTGKHDLEVEFDQSLIRSLAYASGSGCRSVVSGNIYYTQMDTNKNYIYEFKNVTYKTDW